MLAAWAYDDLGRRTSLTRGNGTTTTYGHDAVSRLSSLTQDLGGTASDVTFGFSSNPAGGIASRTRSNDAYAWDGAVNVNRDYTANGLNQYTASGGATPSYDTRGNLTQADGPTFTYSSENLLTAATGGVALSYDPATRLYQTSDGTTTTRFAYDGADMIAEYNGSSALQRRYVFDPVSGSPLVWYEGTGTSDRRFMHEDERGSVIATSNSAGTMLSIDSYDEFGIPASTNTGRFGYTGQAWLPELGMAYYRARVYSPTLGRFMQTDPIGYGDGMNIYAYVHNDPINFTDPSGLTSPDCPQDDGITVCGHHDPCSRGATCYSPGDFDLFTPTPVGDGRGGGGGGGETIVVTGTRRHLAADPCMNQTTGLGVGELGNLTAPFASTFEAVHEKYTQHLSPRNPNTGRAQSQFGFDLRSSVQLFDIVGSIIESSNGVPAGFGRVRITAASGILIGRNARNGNLPTQYLTIILEKTPIIDDRGRTVVQVVSVFPGC